ncbi:MAG: YceI family protein [Pyrinomonadaceae bacterium]
MFRSSLVLTTLALLFVCSCANPASDKPQAVTNEAAPVAASPVAAQGERYLVTPKNSKIEFVGSKVTGSHTGSFEKFSGAIDFNGRPETSRVSINIDTTSITTDTPDLTKHLKSPDFFDVAKYPEATFVSTEIKPGGEKGTHTVTGNLNLHGVTKSITFPATIAVNPDAITVDSTFSINRKEFGINFAGAADNLIRDEVVLTLKVRGVK